MLGLLAAGLGGAVIHSLVSNSRTNSSNRATDRNTDAIHEMNCSIRKGFSEMSSSINSISEQLKKLPTVDDYKELQITPYLYQIEPIIKSRDWVCFIDKPETEISFNVSDFRYNVDGNNRPVINFTYTYEWIQEGDIRSEVFYFSVPVAKISRINNKSIDQFFYKKCSYCSVFNSCVPEFHKINVPNRLNRVIQGDTDFCRGGISRDIFCNQKDAPCLISLLYSSSLDKIPFDFEPWYPAPIDLFLDNFKDEVQNPNFKNMVTRSRELLPNSEKIVVPIGEGNTWFNIPIYWVNDFNKFMNDKIYEYIIELPESHIYLQKYSFKTFKIEREIKTAPVFSMVKRRSQHGCI